MNRNGNDIRICKGCGKSEDDVILFSIIMPPDIPDKTLLCKQCMVIAVDNSKKKNEAKQRDR